MQGCLLYLIIGTSGMLIPGQVALWALSGQAQLDGAFRDPKTQVPATSAGPDLPGWGSLHQWPCHALDRPLIVGIHRLGLTFWILQELHTSTSRPYAHPLQPSPGVLVGIVRQQL